jgi:hypothetical protein
MPPLAFVFKPAGTTPNTHEIGNKTSRNVIMPTSQASPLVCTQAKSPTQDTFDSFTTETTRAAS